MPVILCAENTFNMKQQKIVKILGWVLTGIVSLLLIFSAFLKITQNELAVAQATAAGININTYQIIGVIELLAVVLFIIPRTGVVGTLLLAAYMGGAIVTHLVHQEPYIMPLTIQVIVWITAVIRFPELRERLYPARK